MKVTMNQQNYNKKNIIKFFKFGLIALFGLILMIFFFILQLFLPARFDDSVSLDCSPQYDKSFLASLEEGSPPLLKFDVKRDISKKKLIGFPLAYNSYEKYSTTASSEEICEDLIENAYIGGGHSELAEPVSQSAFAHERLDDANTNILLLGTNVLILTGLSIVLFTGSFFLMKIFVRKLSKKISEDMKKSEEHLL